MCSDKLGLFAAEAEARMVHFNFEKSKRLTLVDDLIAILVEHLLGREVSNRSHTFK